MGDAILERREHAFEVGEEAREEVRARRPRPVDPDRFLVAAVLADRFRGPAARPRRPPDPSAAIAGPDARPERRAAPDLLPTSRAPRRAAADGVPPASSASACVPADAIDQLARRLPPPRRARLLDRAAPGSARHSRSGSHTHEARRCPGRCGRRRTARPAPTGSGRRGAALARWRSGSGRRTGHAARARASTAPVPGDSGVPTAPAPMRRVARAGPARRRRAPRCRVRSRAGARRPSRPPPAAALRRWRRARRRSPCRAGSRLRHRDDARRSSRPALSRSRARRPSAVIGVARGAAAAREIPDRQRQQRARRRRPGDIAAVLPGDERTALPGPQERRDRSRRGAEPSLAPQSRRRPERRASPACARRRGWRRATPAHRRSVHRRVTSGSVSRPVSASSHRSRGSPSPNHDSMARPRSGCAARAIGRSPTGQDTVVQQTHRRRAAVLGVRTEHAGRIVVARRRGERHRHAGQPREAAGALEHPHAGAVRLDPPGRESLEPHRLVGPAAAQVVQVHAIGERHIQHAVRSDAEIASAPRAAAAAARRQAGGCARRWRRRRRSIAQPRRECRPHAGWLRARCWPRRRPSRSTGAVRRRSDASRNVPHSACHAVCARAGQCAASASSQKRSPLASISRPRAPPARRPHRHRQTDWAARGDRSGAPSPGAAVDDQHREQLGQLPVFERQRLRRIGGVARQQPPLGAVLAVGAAEQVDAADFEDARPRARSRLRFRARARRGRAASRRRRCRPAATATAAASTLRARRRASRRGRVLRES